MAKGLFIVLEGIDGSGTTTQAARLVEWLQGQKRRAVSTCEPTSGPVGSLIRQVLSGRLSHLRGGEHVPFDEVTLALLFAADRSDHMQNVVLPAVEDGRIVVSDRHYLSSVAYQALGVEMPWLEDLNSIFRRPDLTVFLEIEPELSLQRKHAHALAAERYEHLEFLAKVRDNYHRAIGCARAAGEHIAIVDGSPPPDDVEHAIRELTEELLARGEGG
jgi:dTMP kinase